MEDFNNDKLERAKEKVKKIKGFYVHLMVYFLINIFIIGNIIYNSGWDALLNFSTFITPFFWGIGIVVHFSKAFGYDPIFGKEWEQRKIKKIMEEERKEADEYLKNKR